MTFRLLSCSSPIRCAVSFQKSTRAFAASGEMCGSFLPMVSKFTLAGCLAKMSSGAIGAVSPSWSL